MTYHPKLSHETHAMINQNALIVKSSQLYKLGKLMPLCIGGDFCKPLLCNHGVNNATLCQEVAT